VAVKIRPLEKEGCRQSLNVTPGCPQVCMSVISVKVQDNGKPTGNVFADFVGTAYLYV
jgi:hypothetical protein